MRAPKWLRPIDDLQDEDKKRQALGLRVLRIIVLFMFAVVSLYGVVAYVAGTGLFLPKTAEGVLKSVETPDTYAWTSESVRRVRFPGDPDVVEQQALRSAVVNLTDNQFQTMTAGVLADRTIISSDGKYTVRVGSESTNWVLATDICSDKPTVPAHAVAIPTAQDLLDLNPQIVSTEATLLNQQAWALSFEPDRAFISRMFWLGFFDKAISSTERRWVLSSTERQALADGDFDVEYARAWVGQEKPRYLLQMEVRLRFTSEGGSSYRFLLKLNPQDRKLGLTFGDPGCGGNHPVVPQPAAQPLSDAVAN